MQNAADKKDRIVVCVCTYNRPVMLAQCLASLSRLELDAAWNLRLIVVDNNPNCRNRSIVNDLRRKVCLPIEYIEESRAGIPFARNAALDAASRLTADWLVFIDDDATASPDWLLHLMAKDYRSSPILMGHVKYVLPVPRPFWAISRHVTPPERTEGCYIDMAETNNVRIAMEVVNNGVRFTNDIRQGAGDDTIFFLRARRAGYRIRYTARAVTYEVLHAERLSYCAQFYRTYCQAASSNRILFYLEDRKMVVSRRLCLAPAVAILGGLEVLISPVAAMVSPNTFKAMALRGGRRIARSFGVVAGAIGSTPQLYKHTAGA